MNKQWWKEAVVYQIYPRSFCDSNHDGIGDLQGIIYKLDYLKDLGVDVLWLCPVYQSPNTDNGYDISDYQDIMSDFGTMKDFDELLQKAHEKGLKIMMDFVLNHSSDEHAWFIESKKSKDNPYRDYYIWKDQPNNWGSWFSGSAWELDETTNMYYLHIFAKKQPDLNWENPKLRKDIYQMMNWWIDKGIDGMRLDVINLISKNQDYPDGEVSQGLYGDLSPFCTSGPRIHEFIQEMNREVFSHGDIMTVGETPNVTVEEARRFTCEESNELQMVFQFEHMGLDMGPYGKWTDRRFNVLDLKKTLFKWQLALQDQGWNSLYWNNHDQPRVVSRFGNDTVYREKSAKMLALCLHMLKGTPYIYQGEELGMTNVKFDSLDDYRDVETLNAYQELVVEHHKLSHEEMMKGIHSKGRDNARTPMQWSDEAYAGFSDTTPWIGVNPNYHTINAQSQVNDPDSIYAFYRKLIQLRKQYEIIVYGKFIPLAENNPDIIAYQRALDGKTLTVLCNFTDQTVKHNIEIPDGSTLLMTNDDHLIKKTLTPYQAIAYLK